MLLAYWQTRAGRRREGAFFLLVGMILMSACGGGASRQDVVAERGAEVMPFDLDATTHIFTKQRHGGIQQVVADDPGNEREIDQIRLHLQEEAKRFSAGDFGDPVSIHGEHMPGLKKLEARYRSIDVTYREEEAGAALVYRTTEQELVDALHAWFDAQVGDHGRHAEEG